MSQHPKMPSTLGGRLLNVMVEPELGIRKIEVLRAVVEEYVRTGEPVGSETVAERSDLGVSSATIRNELSAQIGRAHV